jgi:hypothetical protein
MKPSVILYGPSKRYGYPEQQYPPGYYAPAYYPPPYYYYGPPVNPYEAARQGESADRLASLIWKLVGVIVIGAAVAVFAFIVMAG